MTEQQWRYHTPERDGHAPDDWDGKEVEVFENITDVWVEAPCCPMWLTRNRYRYNAKPLQDATYEPDLLAQCLALPPDQREALIEAIQKPQRDWADDVWERALSAYHGHDAGDVEAAAVIRSMCRPKEGCV